MYPLARRGTQIRFLKSGRFPGLGGDAKRTGQNGRTARPQLNQSAACERLLVACQVPGADPLHQKFLCPRTLLQRPYRVSGSIPAVPVAASQGLAHSTYSPAHRSLCSSFLSVSFLSASTAAIDFFLQ